MLRQIAVFVSMCSLMAPCLGADAGTTELSVEEALHLVKGYLYQDMIVVDGREFTAAIFASPEKNAVARLGVDELPSAEAVRLAVERDYEDHRDEYHIRGYMAQARTREAGATSAEAYQQTLWSVFLDDARYRSRILNRIREALKLQWSTIPEPAYCALSSEVAAVGARLAEALQDPSEDGTCSAARLSVAVRAVAAADPLLVTMLCDELLSQRLGASAKPEAYVQAALRNGWSLHGDDGDPTHQCSRPADAER